MKVVRRACPWVVAHRGLSGVCPENTLEPMLHACGFERAHANGVTCNLFFGDRPDTPEEAVRLCRMGLDAILTNWANTVLPAVRGWGMENRSDG